jgi:phosphoglycolate phosphatase
MNRYEALIFDVDGTLWDASAATAKAWNQVLQPLGLLPAPFSATDICRVTGHPIEQCAMKLLPHIAPSQIPDLLPLLIAGEQQVILREGGTLYAGVMGGIEQLAKAYPLYLISNCQEWYLECFLHFSQLRPYFSGWNCYGKAHLPKAAMFKNLMREQGFTQAIYLGDTAGDQQAAEAAQLDFGYVSYGFGCVPESRLTFNSFPELAAFFLPRH